MQSAIARRSAARLSVLAGVWLVSSEARASVKWKADFETGDLTEFNGSVNASKGTRKNIEFVTDPVQQGTTAGKFTIHEDDTFSTTQMRVQVTRSGSPTAEGQDVFMSWYFRLPADPLIRDNIAYWETSGSSRNMMTWWVAPKPGGGGTTFDFGTGNLGSTKHIYTGDISINQWHQVGSQIHWSQNAQQGHIIVWLDGVKIVDEAALTKPDANNLFFQAGIHRANRSTFVDAILFDNFIEGDSVADLELVAPMPGSDAGAPDGGALDASDAGGTGSGSGGAGGAAGSGGAGGDAVGSGGAAGSTVSTGGAAGSGGAGTGVGTSGGAGGSGGALASGAGGSSAPPPVEEDSGCTIARRGGSRGRGTVAIAMMLATAQVLRRRRDRRVPVSRR